MKWFAGLLLAISFAGYMAMRDISTDRSPAAAFCVKAEAAGYACVVSPAVLTASVVALDDGMGTQSLVLLVIADGKVVQVIPLGE